jgi:DNA adenine methylase
MSNGTRRAETVNDADGFLANFWRALAHDPEAVAHWCDWPVNEVDLFARHLWLVNTGRSRLLEGMEADPDFYDAQVAGWWVWGVNAWIGSGWCSGDGPWVDTGDGIRKRPHLGDAGRAGYNNMEYRPNVLGYFEELAGRLRDVRVCCGDWSRVCTSGAMSYGSKVGVFLDPPYLRNTTTKGTRP